MSTYSIDVGGVTIGGGATISIQSMTNTKTSDIELTIAQIKRLEATGCEIVRVAVVDESCAKAIGAIVAGVTIPVVADIHFDHRLAILAAESGAHKIRINPGNIGTKDEVKKVAHCCKAHKIPIRAGINGGSLQKDILYEHGSANAKALAKSALENVGLLESFGFYDICISIKSSDVKTTIDANTLIAQQVDYPLHVGVTEAGTRENAIIKSSAALAPLLLGGIGDTLRVSISGDPVQEVVAAKKILNLCGIRRFSPVVISCPTCGRTNMDVAGMALEVERAVADMDKPIKIAVMGCVVNGIGEGKACDVGIAGGEGKCALFARGEYIKTVDYNGAVEALKDYIINF